MTALEEIKTPVEAEIERVVQSVNEWDDRTSPDDYPEHLLITSEELADILRNFADVTLESLNSENERLRQFLFPYADRTDISGMSWDGKYLIGDKASISAFREMQNRGLQIDVYKRAYDEKEAALKARAEAAEAEVTRLQAEIDRKSSMPGDHRYWEGRYRDEAAQKETLREALKPFVSAFERRRESYSKRYPTDRELGYANFDKMPDDWAMEKLSFNMLAYRRARTALASAGGEHHAE